jgi:hypothetical protein
MRKILLAIILVSITLAPNIGLAYSSNVCKTQGTSTCTTDEVGAFMQDISKACGNLGDCTLGDIMMVFNNIGNFVLSIIGGIVLLMYVVGGFYMMSSGGSADRVKKGKKYITISTVGLLIVMFAWTGIHALQTAIQHGTVYGTGGAVSSSDTYTSLCTDLTVGWDCGTAVNETCTEELICESECRQTHPDEVNNVDEGILTYYDCIDTSRETETIVIESDWNAHFDRDSCSEGLCPGDENNLCCQIILNY